jgi:GH24 family phage-related lysozyme (muramidase)
MNIEDRIKQHEGLSLSVYNDTMGLKTIYYGHRVRQGEVYLGTIEDAEKYLKQDIATAKKDCYTLFPDWDFFTQNRQDALADFLYQLGINKARRFVHMVAAINTGRWNDAAREMQDSAYFNQVPDRALENIQLLTEG